MTKFLCIDFDGTLSDSNISSLIKKITDFKKVNSLDELKIGIVTSRSIYDDFRTPGQFYHEIADVLVNYNIELDFISTRFCLHMIDKDKYAEDGIAQTIKDAIKIPIFGDLVSDYLAYRDNHSTAITALRSSRSSESYESLQEKVQSQIDFELALRAKYIQDKMIGHNTPKINQIETLIRSYNVAVSDSSVLLLDDATKHVRAVSSYDNDNWQGQSYFGNDEEVSAVLAKFVGMPLQQDHKATKSSTNSKFSLAALLSKFYRSQHYPVTLSQVDETVKIEEPPISSSKPTI